MQQGLTRIAANGKSRYGEILECGQLVRERRFVEEKRGRAVHAP
jgi:hypothetical protein